ncbi:energy transducer TonB [Sneathiella sp.]|uniref:energy transducer TonB n=1 Tax=Sneathiella sp. TaxID=1964365 RepID=UPI00260E2D8E|nr:energy transducer TonB [Sneathiella sp.]MDF2368029.1 energy transducer TonB [Sneathiella sp.]
MRIVTQVGVFVLLSLVVHMALAAIWAPKEPEVQMERSIGGVALKIGTLIHSSRSTVSPIEPIETEVVKQEKVTKPTLVEQDPLPPEIAPKVTAKKAIVAKEVKKKTPVTPLKKKEVTPLPPAKPVKVKKPLSKPLRKEVVQAKSPEKPVVAEKIAPTVSNLDQLRGGVVASSQGQENMITGSSGNKITQGGNAETSNYRGKVREVLLKNKFYPKMAKRFQMEGNVIFAFTIHRDGRVTALRVLNSSGHAVLDKAALRMVEISMPFVAFPADIKADHLDFRFPATYTVE